MSQGGGDGEWKRYSLDLELTTGVVRLEVEARVIRPSPLSSSVDIRRATCGGDVIDLRKSFTKESRLALYDKLVELEFGEDAKPVRDEAIRLGLKDTPRAPVATGAVVRSKS